MLRPPRPWRPLRLRKWLWEREWSFFWGRKNRQILRSFGGLWKWGKKTVFFPQKEGNETGGVAWNLREKNGFFPSNCRKEGNPFHVTLLVSPTSEKGWPGSEEWIFAKGPNSKSRHHFIIWYNKIRANEKIISAQAFPTKSSLIMITQSRFTTPFSLPIYSKRTDDTCRYCRIAT